MNSGERKWISLIKIENEEINRFENLALKGN